jgi:hypothetical protein
VRLRREIDNLIERTGDEIGELELDDRAQALDGGRRCGADESTFADRRIDHAVGAELLDEPACDLECAAEGGNVFAEQDHVAIPPHLITEAIRDGLEVCPNAHSANNLCVTVDGSGGGSASA